ncbi:MAG TPA: SLBB domain-containing protein [Clostridia bacterium]|jgi:Na+-translocating ferredoxin:NAD+ oxidoreductase RnfC subunit|nr:SLBB domain-containing protein [Clostridia bacterium]HQO55056.1 SLBB domain-containing protein [Clostridia bacterium]HUM59849.1 SLBB domain-containing protein [Clostridia bacterium]
MNGLEQLLHGGVVGGGGAGFPTWKKLSAPAEQLLINGAECEPLLKSDQYLMRRYPAELVEAASRLAGLVGAREAVICLKDHYTEQIAALRRAIDEKGMTPPVRLHLLPTVYPIGDEQSLVHSATGKTVPPGALPGSVGCTVCSVSTALNALRALKDRPVTSRFVTVAGEVSRPGVYRAPIGMPVSLLLQQAGMAADGKYRLMLGGPMMGALVPLETEAVVTKTLGGVLVLPREHTLVRHAELPIERARVRARSTCIQCRTCTDLCPRYLLGHPIYPHLSMRAFSSGQERIEPSAMLCMECGICEMYACPMGLNPRRVQQMMKAELRAKGEKPVFELKEPPALAEHHGAPSGRVLAHIHAQQYDIPVPAEAIEAVSPVVCIPLKQHIGAPAAAVVTAGQSVSKGDVIGRMAEGALGADVHASICGTVEKVENDIVVIRSHA